MVTMVWWGGANYACGSVHEAADREEFPTLAAAVQEFRDRLDNRTGSTPCVEADASAHVWFGSPVDADGRVEEYPHRLITVGPRGGVRVERA